MKSKLFLGLSEHRRFWRLRVDMHRLTFTILARFFQLRYFASEEKANSRILASFFRVAFIQLFFAAIVAFALELFELFLLPPFFWRWDSPNSSDYVTWLGTFSQIGGVFIALYFTAVTAAAGAIYAQVPNNIRDLLARERVGNIYIRYLTFATFVPLCLVALRLVGFEPLRLAVPFIVIVGGIGIVCFTTLGRRAFDLFDPTRLSSALFADFGSWLRQVSAGGFRWQDSAFQNHAHRQANAVADTLNTLADLASTHANLDSSPLLEFSIRILALLEEYKRRKLLIPSDSLWFEQKYQHSDWFLSPDSATGMAYRTGGALSPKAVSQPNWLEDRLQSIPIKCLKLNLERHRYDNIRDLLSGIYSYVDTTTSAGR